ncbi:hypothetical protein BJX76DRAFT_359091 [Aspergillus varians]
MALQIHTLGVPLGTQYSPSDKKAALGLIVYATASPQHHEYLKQLGAAKVSNYKVADVAEQSVVAVRGDGVTLDIGFLATDDLQPSQDILRTLNPSGGATLASGPLVAPYAAQVKGVEVKSVMLPLNAQAREVYVSKIFREWLAESRSSGEFVPSPPVKILKGAFGCYSGWINYCSCRSEGAEAGC